MSLAAIAAIGSGTTDALAAPGDFVTVWETTSDDEVIVFPGRGTYTIDWGDGTIDQDVESTQQHTYGTAGNHTVNVSGGLEAINLAGDRSNAAKLLSIEQWGNIEWTTMNQAFRRAINMVYNASDAPDLSDVENMIFMFSNTPAFNGDLSSWDVSSVTTMTRMFQRTSVFNGNISSWDVSSVTSMQHMFLNAVAFNGDLSRWNVSSVTRMDAMFFNATAFNSDLSRWDVSSVTDMPGIFYDAVSFNGNISSWDVSSVTDISRMFSGATIFNGDISSWDVSSVDDMYSMFRNAAAFNGNLSSWNVSSVISMNRMFFGVSFFNSDISSWDVSSVDDMNFMFDGASLFDQNLGNWYVVPADTTYATSEGTLSVTTISTQNTFLDDPSLSYAIGSGGNSTLFNITDSKTLMFKSAPSAGTYNVNVTAFGTNVFESGNNWRLLEIEVTGQTTGTTPPMITAPGSNHVSVPVLDAYSDEGATCVDGVGVDLTVMTESNVDTAVPGTYTITYSCTDSASNEATATRMVTVTGDPVKDHFVTTWRTTSPNESITIPATGPYTVKWSNDTASENATDSTSHEYPSSGTYTVRIYGGLKSIDLSGDSSNAEKLQSIKQWGNAEWTTMNSAFRGASDMVYNADDAPDLSGVTDMTGMFYGASAFNGNIRGGASPQSPT